MRRGARAEPEPGAVKRREGRRRFVILCFFSFVFNRFVFHFPFHPDFSFRPLSFPLSALLPPPPHDPALGIEKVGSLDHLDTQALGGVDFRPARSVADDDRRSL